MDEKDRFSLVVSTRSLEIQLFWQRSNYFLVLSTALAFGFFQSKSALYTTPLALLGIAVCWLWYNVNLGSKYWQSRWEEAAWQLEEQMQGKPESKLFSVPQEEVLEIVKKSLGRNRHNALERWFDNRILQKPSVTTYMALLPLLFAATWIILLLVSLYLGAAPSAAPSAVSR